jgi:hypothetical protein
MLCQYCITAHSISGRSLEFWIGIKRNESNLAQFLYGDGTPIGRSFWVRGEPYREADKCVMAGFMTQYGWNDINCYYSKEVVCEFQL